jgi:RNA polymerase sigma factor (sigma-70 family)
MSGTRPAELLRHLEQSAFASPDAAGDGDLLDAFVHRRDQAAFAVLVRRHGSMVLSVCRRITNHPQDAEDAFQAVFLVLARRATAIRNPGLLGNWLYGVAVRVAQKARRTAARRRAREVQIVDIPEPTVPAADPPADIGPVLHDELARLPAHYRDAIVLCDLRGVSRADAAKALGIPEGTLSSRLAGGRKRLADRLARRGVALSAAVVPVALADGRAATLPDSLVSKTCGLVADWAAGTAIPGSITRLAQGSLSVRKTLFLGLLTTALVGAGAVFAARLGNGPTAGDPSLPPGPAVAKAGRVPDPATDLKPGEKAERYTTKPVLRRVIDLPIKNTYAPVWSADGNRLALSGILVSDIRGAGKELVACVLELTPDKIAIRQTLEIPQAGSLVGFTPDGQQVVTALHESGLVSGFHRLDFWNLAGPVGPRGIPGEPGPGRPVYRLTPDRTVDLDAETTEGYALAPDGKTYRTVVTQRWNDYYTKLSVREVSTETGKTLRTVAQLNGEYDAYQLSRNGKRLVVSSVDVVEIHNLETGKKVSVPRRIPDPQINAPGTRSTLAVSPTDAVVLVNRGIDRPTLLNGDTGEQLPSPEGVELAEAYLASGSFTADGRLAAALVARYVKKEVGAGEQKQTSIAPGGTFLEVWDTRKGEVVKSWAARNPAVAFHPTRPVLAVSEANGDKTRLGLWDFSAEVPKDK